MTKKGEVRSVKGFTYEFNDLSNAHVFSASVKENANVWFRRYNNPAAFDASEQHYGSAAGFAGQNTPTVSPGSGSQDSQAGELFSVSQVSDGTSTGFINSTSSDGIGLAYDGQYLYNGDFSNGQIIQLKTDGTEVNSYSPPKGSSQNVAGLAWDGNYLWLQVNSSNALYQLQPDSGNSVFSTGVSANTLQGIIFDGSYIYAADRNVNGVYRFRTDGSQSGFFGVESQVGGGNNIEGMGYDGKYFYIGGQQNSLVYRFDRKFNKVDSFSQNAGREIGMAWDGSYMWASDFNNSIIYRETGSNSLDISYRFAEIT